VERRAHDHVVPLISELRQQSQQSQISEQNALLQVVGRSPLKGFRVCQSLPNLTKKGQCCPFAFSGEKMKQISMPNTGNGIAYSAVKLAHLKMPVWVLRDEDSVFWVDLRSVLRSAGMSYSGWHKLLLLQYKPWNMKTCLDRHASETVLLPEQSFVKWLGAVADVIGSYPEHTQAKVRMLRASWNSAFEDLIETSVDVSGLPRKVTPRVILQAHQLRRVVGKSINNTARELGISSSLLKQIEVGSSKWPADVRKSWRQSFGSPFDAPSTP
jgi:hypothetical protein